MANHRTYTDDQLKAAFKSATCWGDVMEAIGKKRGGSTTNVRKIAERLNLDTSRFGYHRSCEPVRLDVALPFSAPLDRGHRSGLSVAAQWFLDRGYAVSLPIEPAPYDLVSESDEGLKKVQVKTTRRKTRGGRHWVALVRTVYRADLEPNAQGKYRQARYEPGAVDLFFIITSTGAKYLIPDKVVESKTSLVLDDKYKAFLVD